MELILNKNGAITKADSNGVSTIFQAITMVENISGCQQGQLLSVIKELADSDRYYLAIQEEIYYRATYSLLQKEFSYLVGQVAEKSGGQWNFFRKIEVIFQYDGSKWVQTGASCVTPNSGSDLWI